MTSNGEPLPKTYDPREAESRWYSFWEREGLFRASSDPKDNRAAYTIAIPPPNVTGSLHMGHACRVTFEDVLIRHKRMQGYNTLWIPGMDHAGIATQTVVERQLSREGLSRHDLGREKFVERVWKWKDESGGRILEQLRVLGASCDWSRERFTMDEGLSHAVREVFVRLYEEGLMYRDTRLIHWCIDCRTSLSDLEVETEENVQGELFEFAYPVEGGGEAVVATTRPETMLGDTAVAIHPDDPRYKSLHGRFVIHPFVARRIPIICDAELVDPAFGTGMVKVTPAHDFNDFATGKRHNLEEINILNLDGTLNQNAGPFQGMDRFKARKAVKAQLEEKGLSRGSRPHTMTLPRCQRSNTIVEPIISTQWFARMKPLAEPAIAAVEQGKTAIIPEDWTKTYFHFMRNIQDWCVSRQLWWGHPIPAWYCDACEEVHVQREAPAQCKACGKATLRQDPDVLDTWFSSALWPFSTLGWPERTLELQRFYPTSDMETGYDILFFWVARMMMMGLHFMGDVPFRRVLLSGLVTDERGEKMSKVKGNVIDPLDVIHGASLEQLVEKANRGGAGKSAESYLRKTYPEGFATFGADALRCTLLSYSPQTRKIALSIKRVEGYRNFCNKLWNAARFSLMKLEGTVREPGRPSPTLLANRWILSRLSAAIDSVESATEEYRLDEASNAFYHFVWHELCDWYLELAKALLDSQVAPPQSGATSGGDGLPAIPSSGTALRSQSEETQQTLLHVLESTLRLMHPFMPFITEEIWQRVPKSADAPKSIMIAPFPTAEQDGLRDADVDRDFALLQSIITAARTVRAEHDVPRSKTLSIEVHTAKPDVRALLEKETPSIQLLCRADVRVLLSPSVTIPPRTAVTTTEGLTVLVSLEGLIDVEKERGRLQRELEKVERDVTALERKLGNPEFVNRAPADVVQKDKERLSELTAQRQKLRDGLEQLA